MFQQRDLISYNVTSLPGPKVNEQVRRALTEACPSSPWEQGPAFPPPLIPLLGGTLDRATLPVTATWFSSLLLLLASEILTHTDPYPTPVIWLHVTSALLPFFLAPKRFTNTVEGVKHYAKSSSGCHITAMLRKVLGPLGLRSTVNVQPPEFTMTNSPKEDGRSFLGDTTARH